MSRRKIAQKESSVADACPKCGGMSYRGGNCFKCGTYRPPPRGQANVAAKHDAVDFMKKEARTRLLHIGPSEDRIDEAIALYLMYEKHRLRQNTNKGKSNVYVDAMVAAETALLVQGIVEPYGSTPDGELVRALAIPWRAITELLKQDWMEAYKIPARVWEEIIAAAFDRDGYDQVTLTPRSGDFGRDVIAVKNGVGCVRIIDSVKAYKPGHLVKHDDVRALAGVLLGEHNSKGIITTTSDFAPGIVKDKILAPLMPFRLELMNGTALREWLTKLS
jgi:restriction system protein